MTVAAFRVDADREKGMGHLERCFSIATELTKENHDSVFVTRDKAFVKSLAAARGFNRVEIVADDSGETEAILSQGPGLVIFDIGSTRHDQVAPIKEVGCHVVTFEDLGDGRYLSDLVVDCNLSEKMNPAKLTTSTRYLLGAEYAVVSQACLAAKKRRFHLIRRRRDRIRKIIVSCGGSDPEGVTPKVAKALSRFDTEIDIELVLGPAFVHTSELDNALLDAQRVFSIVEAPMDLAKRLKDADLGIVSGGATLFEAAYLGLPCLVIAQNAAQLRNLPPFEAHGGIVNLGLAANDPFSNIPGVIKSISDSGRLGAMSAAQESYVDGRGLERILAAIRELLGR